MQWTRRGMMAGLLAGIATPLLAEDPGIAPRSSLFPRRRGDGGAAPRQIAGPDRLIAAAKLGGTVGFVLADAATGAVLEAHDPDSPLPPASVMKAMTAAYALDRLGLAHRFGTRVLVTGPVMGGIVQGDLVLVGGGDPVLDTDMLGDMAAQLAAKGIKGVTGRYLLWDAALPMMERIDDEQPEFVGYNPAVSGLNLNFNRVHFEWRRNAGAWNLTMDARAERFIPAVSLVRASVAQRETPLFTYKAGAHDETWTVASAALGKGGARWLPVRHPALYTGEVFRTLLTAHAITLPEAERIETLPAGQDLLRHDSLPLSEVLRDMLKHSTNLTAEVAGMTASQAASHSASAIAMREWARGRHNIDPVIADHSGLGAGSRVSAAQMVRLLVDVQGGPLPGLLKDHGMHDEKGTQLTSHPVTVRAKTGTLNFVSTLAGYIDPPGGRRMAFAIFAGDLDRRAKLSLAERERPQGGSAWNKRAKVLQGQLITRWATMHA